MPKRKLSDFESTPQTNSSNRTRPSIQVTRLNQLFDQGVQSLSRALKTARGFERQKLGKREQKAKKEKDAKLLERIGEEIGALKGLDYSTTATNYIFKQMLKTKSIAESAPFNEFKQIKNINPSGPGSTAEANVFARMFKSKPVQGVMPGIMNGFRRVLGVEEKAKGAKTEKKGDVVKEKSVKEKKGGKEDGRDARVPSKHDEGSDAEVSDEDVDDDGESEDFSHFDSRLAPDSDEDSDEEEQPDLERNPSASISRSPSISQSRSPSPPPKKSKTQPESKKPATSTTFLPSLSMGGYFSGSESEPEEIDQAPVRKNRMGQQARRALWEKKYGSGANHVKKAKKAEKGNRDSGWDLRRGATDSGERRGRGREWRGQDGGQRGGRGDGGNMAKGAPKVDDKPMHPSWEAARKAKEQKASAEFKGKKVVFD